MAHGNNGSDVSLTRAPKARKKANGSARQAEPNGVTEQRGMSSTMRNALGAQVPVREWDHLSAASRAEIEHMVEVLKAMKQGDFSVRFEYEQHGVLSRVGELLNDVIGLSEHTTGELVRVAKVVGQEGRMHERASVGTAKGAWAEGMTSVNQLIADLVAPTNEVARVITAVARGDLSQKMVLEIDNRPVRGEFLRIGTTVNSMVDQLELVRGGSDARGEGSGQRRQAGRAGRSEGRFRHLARPHRQRERPGGELDRAGAQHRQGDHGRGQG
ncbi:MAG: HAMP domain-containing protein [Polyangiaceae bacterium]